jgi:hypothetical protein
VIRLTGLPAAARFGRAEVTLEPDVVRIVFSGPGGSRAVEAPLAYVGTEDVEGAVLRLLADLRRLGYEPSWRREEGR